MQVYLNTLIFSSYFVTGSSYFSKYGIYFHALTKILPLSVWAVFNYKASGGG